METPNGNDLRTQLSWLGFKGKTLWDWLNLLIVPGNFSHPPLESTGDDQLT